MQAIVKGCQPRRMQRDVVADEAGERGQFGKCHRLGARARTIAAITSARTIAIAMNTASANRPRQRRGTLIVAQSECRAHARSRKASRDNVDAAGVRLGRDESQRVKRNIDGFVRGRADRSDDGRQGVKEKVRVLRDHAATRQVRAEARRVSVALAVRKDDGHVVVRLKRLRESAQREKRQAETASRGANADARGLLVALILVMKHNLRNKISDRNLRETPQLPHSPIRTSN